MFPVLRQRVLILLTTLIGGLVWVLATGFVRATDLSPGLAVIDAHSGIIVALIMLVICGLPAMVGALVVAGTGRIGHTDHGLGGPFVLGAALCFVAIDGGGSSGYIWRSAEVSALPGAYGFLMIETLGWALALGGFLWVVNRLAPLLRMHMPRWLIEPGQDEAHDSAQRNAADLDHPRLFYYTNHGLAAGLVSAVIGGLGVNIMVASPQTGQLIGGVGLSFILAGLLTRLIIGQSNPTLVLLSPALVALVAYARVWLSWADQSALLAAWYGRALPDAAIALPIHYFSAGLAGVAAGFGLGQAMVNDRQGQME